MGTESAAAKPSSSLYHQSDPYPTTPQTSLFDDRQQAPPIACIHRYSPLHTYHRNFVISRSEQVENSLFYTCIPSTFLSVGRTVAGAVADPVARSFAPRITACSGGARRRAVRIYGAVTRNPGVPAIEAPLSARSIAVFSAADKARRRKR